MVDLPEAVTAQALKICRDCAPRLRFADGCDSHRTSLNDTEWKKIQLIDVGKWIGLMR